MTDAQFRTMQAAILEQEEADIDVITGGETHRRTHNRHSPPNAMLNHFWQKIAAFQSETRPKRFPSTIRMLFTQRRYAKHRSLTRLISVLLTNFGPHRALQANQ